MTIGLLFWILILFAIVLGLVPRWRTDFPSWPADIVLLALLIILAICTPGIGPPIKQ